MLETKLDPESACNFPISGTFMRVIFIQIYKSYRKKELVCRISYHILFGGESIFGILKWLWSPRMGIFPKFHMVPLFRAIKFSSKSSGDYKINLKKCQSLQSQLSVLNSLKRERMGQAGWVKREGPILQDRRYKILKSSNQT